MCVVPVVAFCLLTEFDFLAALLDWAWLQATVGLYTVVRHRKKDGCALGTPTDGRVDEMAEWLGMVGSKGSRQWAGSLAAGVTDWLAS